MNFLFVHQNFPGQYLHIVRSLLADNAVREGTHQIVFMSEPNPNQMAGVRKVTYARPPVPESTHPDMRDYEMAMRRAQAAYEGAQKIKALGFRPDIMIGHHGWGEMLNLADAFPGVPMLGYFEFFYRIQGTDVNYDPEFPMPAAQFGTVRSKNATNLLALALGQAGQTPTRWQHSTYPVWAQEQIRVIEEGVDLSVCRPDPAMRRKTLTVGNMTVRPGQKLVTYVARNLEPYRGFHSFMRALPRILSRADVVVSVVGGDGISYGAPPAAGGTWRSAMLRELGGRLDPARVHFLGKVPYAQHLALLQRSDAHVYLSYPFVASWSLREALACGCAVIGGDTETVREFLQHGENGRIVPTLDAGALAEDILCVLDDKKMSASLRRRARAYAEQRLDLRDYLAKFRATIEDVAGQPLQTQPLRQVA
ncbi:MAG TPA: glycosyltransferase [Acidocella sp.]|jgi:glycosyltransferase involved in cell wall biosynthesis|uniref:glycosyltransferase n=1 Tax=Acidocella sp. TaxID=50710 RepID=UPI002C285119|nr:glycosyltransferase [Acidocella sp.]HVE23673.1 glycosyltransferase [Acidocella sp.]